jgi:hypothetical protein
LSIYRHILFIIIQLSKCVTLLKKKLIKLQGLPADKIL